MIILDEFELNSYKTTFGTCELCMYSGIADETTYVFKDTETNQFVSVDNYEWSWGTLIEDMYPVESIPRFADFIVSKNIPSFELFNFMELYEEYRAKFEPEDEGDF